MKRVQHPVNFLSLSRTTAYPMPRALGKMQRDVKAISHEHRGAVLQSLDPAKDAMRAATMRYADRLRRRARQ